VWRSSISCICSELSQFAPGKDGTLRLILSMRPFIVVIGDTPTQTSRGALSDGK
jgi:hypothetical protein